MKIAFLGDIAFFGKCSTKGNRNIKTYFGDVAELLSKYDLVIGNLETPFSENKIPYGAKSAYICADKEDVKLLRMLHINAVTLANNHMYDYGSEGVALTRQLLEQQNINFFGLDGEDWKCEIDNNKLAFTGYCCYSTNPLRTVPYGRKGVNEFNVNNVSEILLKNAQDGYLNIISVHAGIEHVNYPSYDTIIAARDFSRIAPYIYYGHHPHVSQGIERINKSLIAYSLGNFCFDDVYSSVSSKPLVQLTENNRSSFILEVEITNNEIVSYKTIPIYIGLDKLYVNVGTKEGDLQKYTNDIQQKSKDDYELMRNKIIADRLQTRKNTRNLEWFIKRIRPRYVKLFLTNILNHRKYIKCVCSYLKY